MEESILKTVARDMVLSDLPEDPSVDPSPHVMWLTAARNSGVRGPSASFGLHARSIFSTQAHTQKCFKRI